MNSRNVLIIEDDLDIARLVALHLEDIGFTTEVTLNGAEGLTRALTEAFDLIILDIMLPSLDGMEVCKKIRAQNPFTPILMLTARSEELDRVLGLELGADDYLTKPFSIRELVARIKAIFRRMEVDQASSLQQTTEGVLHFDTLTIDLGKRKVLLHGKTITLTAKEFDLLALFARNPGRTYTRQELLDLVWGYHFDGYDHTVNSHINRLRNKIEANPAQPLFIRTVWGVGYRFIDIDELPSK